MSKDKRYTLVKNQISGGFLKNFREILDIIPKTVVGKDLGIHNMTFNNVMYDMPRFTLEQLYTLADLIGIDEIQMLTIVNNQYLLDKKSKSLGKQPGENGEQTKKPNSGQK